VSADRELTNDPREMDRRFDNEVSKIATDRLVFNFTYLSYLGRPFQPLGTAGTRHLMQQYRVVDVPLETGRLRGGGVRIDSNKVLSAGSDRRSWAKD